MERKNDEKYFNLGKHVTQCRQSKTMKDERFLKDRSVGVVGLIALLDFMLKGFGYRVNDHRIDLVPGFLKASNTARIDLVLGLL